MRRIRIYVEPLLQVGELVLPEAQSHYLGRVLRLGPGDDCWLFDGSGMEFPAQLTAVHKSAVRVSVGAPVAGQAPSPLRIHLGQGLSRGERMDWVIQKATELGVAEITPLLTERCEVRLSEARQDKRLQHWQKIIISACEQCGRAELPVLHPPMPCVEWMQSLDAELRLVLAPTGEPHRGAGQPRSLAVLVGPEGGLSTPEIEQACDSGFLALRLGPRILRTETAPIAALSLAQSWWGDLALRGENETGDASN